FLADHDEKVKAVVLENAPGNLKLIAPTIQKDLVSNQGRKLVRADKQLINQGRKLEVVEADNKLVILLVQKNFRRIKHEVAFTVP
ncbi:Putative disease resistance TIR-NBS-LRR class protein, partial [Prunus dulcis]